MFFFFTVIFSSWECAMESSAKRKLAGRKVIHSQPRDFIGNVYRFMTKVAETNAPINLRNVQEFVVFYKLLKTNFEGGKTVQSIKHLF